MAAVVTLPPGEHLIHLRSLTGTRVAWDTQIIAQTPVKRANYGDAENMPFADKSFDIVYSFGVLHHTPDTEKSIAEVHRVLRGAR